MTKTAVLVVLWALAESTVVASSSLVNCNSLNSSCSCSHSTDFSHEVTCPTFDVRIELNEKSVDLRCKTQDDPSVFSTLPGLQIEGNERYRVRFWLCPLPSPSVKEVMEGIGVKSVESLQINSYRNYSDSLQKKHFENLYEVSRLILNNNGLTKLPNDLFKDMGNLTWLDMKQNNIDFPKEIFSYTPKLEVLELGKNDLTYLKPGVFKNLTRLRLLNLWGNRLVNLNRSVFLDVPNLESLDLNSNEMESIRPDLFSDLMKLKRLNLYANKFLSLPQGLLSRNTALEEFQMHDNKRPLVSLPQGFLSNLTALKTIRISGCKLSSIPEDIFSGSKKIQDIYLNRNQLSTLQPKTFADLENLVNLDLSQNQIMHLPDKLFSNTKNLKVLKIHNNLLGDIAPNMFSYLVNLEVLNLRFNQIKEIREFSDLKKLKSLDISDNQLTTVEMIHKIDDYSSFHKCVNLEDLQLANNSLTVIHKDWVYNMVRLRTLNLAYNNISSVEITDLNFIADGVTIDLANNRIKAVDFRSAYAVASNLLDNFTSTAERDRKIRPKHVKLDNNPFKCDCTILLFAKFLRYQLEPEVNYLFDISSDNLRCNEPANLEKMLLSRVPYKLLTCELTNSSSLPFMYTCPGGCVCEYRSIDRGNIVNCQNAGLQHIPIAITQSPIANHSELNLQGNRLLSFELPDDENFKNVTTFNLSNNNLTDFSVDRFSSRVKELDLSFNNLARLREDVVLFLERAEELELLEVHGNPWSCDCEAKSFIRLIKARYNLVPHIHNVTCSDGTPLGKVEESELCSERASTVIVLCIIFAIFGILIAILTALYYRYRTQIHIYCFSSKWKILRWLVSHPDDVDEDKKHDAFISFANEDASFVSEQLVPYLEGNHDTQFKLCLHYRDWVPGESIPNQILRSVQDSRRTIVVLSPKFLESVWGKAEFKTAHALGLKEGMSRVIMILYEDVGPIDKLDEDLKAYLQMNSYVQWGSPWFWQQLRYALPHPPEDARDINCALCCVSKPKTNSSSHEVLQNVQIKDGEVHFNMSGTTDKVNGKDKNILSEAPIIMKPVEVKTKDSPVDNYENGKTATCL